MAFFICESCGFGSATLLGKCPDCGLWGSLKRDMSRETKSTPAHRRKQILSIKKIDQTPSIQHIKRSTGLYEFDRVAGDGILPGAVLLLAGEPGIGKSTLLLQILQTFRALYVSGEETENQIATRAHRLGVNLENLSMTDVLDVDALVTGLHEMEKRPEIIVIDSIQMLYSTHVESSAGSVAQLRESVMTLVRCAKELHLSLVLVGHVTKDGDIAGPKLVEHMVDTVLSFEGEKMSHYRILRAHKNRFGTVDEIGIFEMTSTGLREVNNPLVFVRDTATSAGPGRALCCSFEGNRPIFFEVQALASKTFLPNPRRVAKGVEYNKVLLLLAVMKKYMRIPVDEYDIYINIAGGIEMKTPSADLGIVAAIFASIRDVCLSPHTLYIGEVGLLGDIRSVINTDRIAKEAKRLGFNIATIEKIQDIASVV